MEYFWDPLIIALSSAYRTRAFHFPPASSLQGKSWNGFLGPADRDGLKHFWPNPDLGLVPQPRVFCSPWTSAPICSTGNGSHPAFCPAASFPGDQGMGTRKDRVRSSPSRGAEREQGQNQEGWEGGLGRGREAGGTGGGGGEAGRRGRRGRRDPEGSRGSWGSHKGPSPFPEAAGVGVTGAEGSSQPQAQGQELQGAQRW